MIARIHELLRSLGVTSHYIGFFQAAHAALLAAREPERLTLVTKRLYPDVAASFGVTACGVERNIRTVIRIARTNNPQLLEQLAGRPLGPRLTVSEFIALLVQSLGPER